MFDRIVNSPVTQTVVIQLFLNLKIFMENFILYFVILSSTMDSRDKPKERIC